MTGTKGTIFTARYINRFHEMQDIILEQEAKLPWFIHQFHGNQIMLFRDFRTITGVEMAGNYTAYRRRDKLIVGCDYNGWGWKCDNEKFKSEYGFDYGTDKCMMYLYRCGIRKALRIFAEEKKNKESEAYRIISEGLKIIEKSNKNKSEMHPCKPMEIFSEKKELPIQINIIMRKEMGAVL